MKYGFFLLIFLSPVASLASYFFAPVGNQEAFLGNAGVGLLCSNGSPLYNPAGIAFCQYHVNLSISGTSIAYHEMADSAFYNQTGSLTSSTLLTSAIFSIDENIRMGFYYSYPANTENTFRVADGSGNTLAQEIRHQAALAGISYGGMISETLAWGFSIGVTWNELNDNKITNSVSGGSTTSLNEKVLEQENYLILNPGIAWRVSDTYSLGATLQWRALNLYAEGDLYQNQLSTGDTQATETFRRYTPHTGDILGVTLGQVFRFSENSFLFDVSYAPRYALPSVPSEQQSNLTLFNVSMGLKAPFRAINILAGGSFTKVADQTMSLFSTGISFNKRTYEANLGIYYQYTKNDSVGAINSDTMGFMYSSSLNY